MRLLPRIVCLFVLGLLSNGCTISMIGGQEGIVLLNTDGLRFQKTVQSWKCLRERNVIMQRFDYSRGAAALATLTRYYFQDNVTEKDVLLNILEQMTDEEIQERQEKGFSLLDLHQWAVGMGYQAVGVRLQYSALPKLKGPIIIHLDRDGYKHFAVLRGVRGDRVYLADPSRGNIRMSINWFLREWTGVALALGKKGFGLSEYPISIGEVEAEMIEVESVRKALNLAR